MSLIEAGDFNKIDDSFDSNDDKVKGAGEPKTYDGEKHRDRMLDIFLREQIDSLGIDLSQENLAERLISVLKLESDPKNFLVENILVDGITYDLIKGYVLESEKIEEKQDEAEEKQDEAEERQDEAEEKQDEAEEKQDIAEENQDEAEEKEKTLSNMNGIISAMDGVDSSEAKSFMGELIVLKDLYDKGKNADDIKEVNERLKALLSKLTNPETLRVIADDIREQDEKNGTKNFDNFRNSVLFAGDGVGIGTELRTSFARYESGLTVKKGDFLLGVDTGGRVDLSGDTLTYDTDDGYKIEAGKKDGKSFRTMSLDNSDYKLDGTIDNDSGKKEFASTQKEIEENLVPLNDRVGKLSSMLDYIDQAITKKLSLKDLKSTLKIEFPDLYGKLGLEYVTRIDLLKVKVNIAFLDAQKEKKKFIEEKKKKLEELVNKNAREAEKKDEITKDMLDFIHRLGFDLIPQEITEQVFDMIKSNQINMQEIIPGFNKNNLDLANGHFGEPEYASNSDSRIQAKNNLARFMNKMLTGNPDEDITGLGSDRIVSSGASIDTTKFKSKMTKLGVYNILTGFNKVKLFANLNSSPIEKDEK